MTTEVELPKVAQTRIARLARAAGRSPAATLRFVLRDGFDAVEQSIHENAIADAEFAAGATVAHADVLRGARNVVRLAKHEARAPKSWLLAWGTSEPLNARVRTRLPLE